MNMLQVAQSYTYGLNTTQQTPSVVEKLPIEPLKKVPATRNYGDNLTAGALSVGNALAHYKLDIASSDIHMVIEQQPTFKPEHYGSSMALRYNMGFDRAAVKAGLADTQQLVAAHKMTAQALAEQTIPEMYQGEGAEIAKAGIQKQIAEHQHSAYHYRNNLAVDANLKALKSHGLMTDEYFEVLNRESKIRLFDEIKFSDVFSKNFRPISQDVAHTMTQHVHDLDALRQKVYAQALDGNANYLPIEKEIQIATSRINALSNDLARIQEVNQGGAKYQAGIIRDSRAIQNKIAQVGEELRALVHDPAANNGKPFHKAGPHYHEAAVLLEEAEVNMNKNLALVRQSSQAEFIKMEQEIQAFQQKTRTHTPEQMAMRNTTHYAVGSLAVAAAGFHTYIAYHQLQEGKTIGAAGNAAAAAGNLAMAVPAFTGHMQSLGEPGMVLALSGAAVGIVGETMQDAPKQNIIMLEKESFPQ